MNKLNLFAYVFVIMALLVGLVIVARIVVDDINLIRHNHKPHLIHRH